MRFLHIHRTSDPKRANSLVLREKKDPMSKQVKETYISKRGIVAIYGGNGSGKSRMLAQLDKSKDELWRGSVIQLKATDSIADIIHKNLQEKADKRVINADDDELDDAEENSENMKQYAQLARLAELSKKSVVLVDDIDRFTGKKLELIKELCRNSKTLIYSAQSESSVNRTVREILHKRKLKQTVINLTTGASYDATNWLFGLFVLVLFVGGAPEAAMLVMAMRYMAKGSR